MKLGTFLATAFLGVVSIAHLYRVILRLEVHVGSVAIPQWMSVVAFLFTGALAVLLFRESRNSSK